MRPRKTLYKSSKVPMQLVPVEKLPDKKNPRTYSHDFVKMFEKFMSMPCQYVEIIVNKDDYANIYVAVSGIKRAISYHNYPIKFAIRDGHLFLVKDGFGND